MAIPILHFWRNYFEQPDEGLGSSYERVIINQRLDAIRRHYGVKRLLESPSFGFTGLSGINSMDMAVHGCDVTITDHDAERLELVRQVWRETGLPLEAVLTPDYAALPFDDDSFDMSWNFSALWFTQDLDAFLSELSRVTRRVIVLCVPNRSGLGYLGQKLQGRHDLRRLLREEHIKPRRFVPAMRRRDWRLLEWSYIDCPPWPDIGMHKEKLLRGLGLGFLVREPAEPRPPLTIMERYRGNDDGFPERMLRYAWFERHAPRPAKHVWAHHRCYVFVREHDEKHRTRKETR
ncbi:MAG: class I SAM-dependent methyltransferase [Candidatus Cloacimonetes bacterium]|nr:class I SAM-dependent methyltransferase [Candidatus Cloacimonadota bacterium]